MSPRHYFYFAAFLACASAVYAVRPPPATPAPKAEATPVPKSTEPVPPYELKSRSTFPGVTEASRAPFWPIGWVRRPKGAPVQAPVEDLTPKMTLDPKNFRVTSILVGSGTTASLAVINGRAYGEGEFLRTPRMQGTPAPSARIRVVRIADGTVTLQSGTQTIAVPLTRPELNERKPEQLLDDKDR